MSGLRNFVLGLLVGVALVIPTAFAASDENALAIFATARSQIEAQVSSSAMAFAGGVVHWIVREISGR